MFSYCRRSYSHCHLTGAEAEVPRGQVTPVSQYRDARSLPTAPFHVIGSATALKVLQEGPGHPPNSFSPTTGTGQLGTCIGDPVTGRPRWICPPSPPRTHTFHRGDWFFLIKLLNEEGTDNMVRGPRSKRRGPWRWAFKGATFSFEGTVTRDTEVGTRPLAWAPIPYCCVWL